MIASKSEIDERTLVQIAEHSLVRLCFPHRDTDRWAFAHFYQALQAQSPTLLSLLDTIERYRCSSFAQLAEVMSHEQ